MSPLWTISLLCLMISIISLLSSCHPSTSQQDGPPRVEVDVSHIPNPTPKQLPLSRYGNPASYTVKGKRYHVLRSSYGYDKRGIASWYGTKFHGRLTSSREPYNMFAMTGASPTLPIPSFVRVTNLNNGRSIIVKINDRGPFVDNRLIDLSYVAAKKLGYTTTGTALVEVKAINFNQPQQSNRPSYKMAHLHPKIYLQIGAFRYLTHARHLRKRVIQLTHRHVNILTGTFKHFPIYRVQIGPLKGVGESDKLFKQLKDLRLGNPVTIIG